METVTSLVDDATDKELIGATLNDYLQGRPVLDIERMRNAFHPDAHIRTIIDGKLVQWTLPAYLDLVAKATIQHCEPAIVGYTWDGDTGSAQVQLTFPASGS